MNVFKLSLLATALVGLTACSDDGKDGTNGANGTNGFNSLVSQTNLSTGNNNCPNSGIQIDSGLDKNSNHTLDSDEITSTKFVCRPGVTQISSSEMLTSVNNNWFTQGQQEVNQAKTQWQHVLNGGTQVQVSHTSTASLATLKGKAKNIILFVGDGMGVSTVTAARILEGQNQGKAGEEHNLSFDQFPFAGLSKTYNVDAQTPDSAGTMTAMVTGVKTDVGVIGVDEDIQRGNCATAKGNELVTALELAEIAGLSTGVVSTARITHATPASTYAKSADRNWEDVSDMPAEAVAAGCKDIADQLVNFEQNLEARYNGLDVNGIEVVMGGGRRHFLPKDATFNSPDASSTVEGDRTDGRDLTAEWKNQYSTGAYIYDQNGFDAINTETTTHLFGLFNESHMQYEADRKNDKAGEPSLEAMTEKAIQILDNNSKGYFLSIESGRIDHGHHAGSAYNALTDTIEFEQAIAKAVEMTNSEDTLIIVTADHSHVFTIAGYPKRGNPILGKVVSIGKTDASLASDGMPYTTLGYTNGRGHINLGSETNADAGYGQEINTGRHDLTDIDTTTPGFHQEALVPRSSETHAGEDVGIYAMGPGAHLVSGTNEQSVIFHIMDYAADLVGKADQAIP